MISVFYESGSLYLGDHIVLNKIAKLDTRSVKLKRSFVITKDEKLYVCGYVSKKQLEDIISKSDTEDCGRIRSVYKQYRKDTGKSVMPLHKIGDLHYHGLADKCRVRFSVKRRIKDV